MNPQTRKLYLCQALEADKGPSVESDVLDERIAARRARIETRIAQQKPGFFKQLIDDNTNDALLPHLSEQQIELSMQRIVNLCRNGNAFITNIKVACDARENLRRMEEEDLSFLRKEKLDIEANNATRVFTDLQTKWANSNSLVIPQQLHDLFEAQKVSCAEMVDNKNRLIYEIHLELKAKDDHFVRELKKRSEDVEIMVERMESQMKSMQRAYTFELQEIEKAFLQERDNLFELHNKDWDDFLEEVRKKQVEYLQLRKERIDELDKLISKLRTKHCEELNALKSKLFGDVQQMETNLQQMKAAFQLNLEKLEYNFQVLKRRDEENSMTKSQQKRKITRLQDHLSHLLIRAKKLEEQLITENEELSDDYKKRMEMFRELQKKSKFLIETEKRNFKEIWNMNGDELKKEAHRLLDADRVIHEQQLGLIWVKPELSFMDASVSRLNYNRNKHTSSMASFALRMSKKSDAERKSGSSNETELNELPTSLRKVPSEIVQQFIDMLCFEPEFLIEEKMKSLLKQMSEEDKKIIRLDAVLTALEVHNEDQLDQLFTYFLLPIDNIDLEETQFAPNDVEAQRAATGATETTTHNSTKYADSPNESTPTPHHQAGFSGNINHSNVYENNADGKVSEGVRNYTDVTIDATPLAAFTDVKRVPVIRLIDSVDVVAALKAFATDFCAGKGALSFQNTTRFSLTNPEEKTLECKYVNSVLTSSPMHTMKNGTGDLIEYPNAEYWKNYKDIIIPEDREKLYSALLKSMNHYREILKGRSKLIVGNEALRLQNCELRHMLDEYLKSKVNCQMEVPPTMTMKNMRR